MLSLLQKIHHTLSLPTPDPLGGGLAEAIAAEREEPEAIALMETPDEEGENLMQSWAQISNDLHQDPLWFSETDRE